MTMRPTMLAVRSILAGAGLALVLAACSHATPSAAPAPGQLDRTFQRLLDDPAFGMSSLSVLAVRDGKVSYAGQFGMRRFGSATASGLPAGSDTLYRIASLSKMVTTIGVMKLVEQGKLALDDDVSGYLGFRLRNPAFSDNRITLRMLLSHTSSLRDGAGYSWGANVALRDIVQQGGAMWAARAAPGAYFAYCNLNFGVVGSIMEAVTGERFDRLMRRLVLQPLAVHGGYNVAEAPAADWANVATLYRKRASAGLPSTQAGAWFAQVDDTSVAPAALPGLDRYVPGRNGTLFSPTGGLRISAADLGRIMLMFMDHGRYEGLVFLQPSSVAAMFSPQWTHRAASANGDTDDGLFAAWGLGIQRFEERAGQRSSLVDGGGFAASGHLGAAYGLLSVFAFDAAKRNGVVVLIGGTARDSAVTPGHYSALSRHEELILTALYENAVLGAQ
jgi:CubicO group peptidase (beta-lactamase class C family)